MKEKNLEINEKFINMMLFFDEEIILIRNELLSIKQYFTQIKEKIIEDKIFQWEEKISFNENVLNTLLNKNSEIKKLEGENSLSNSNLFNLELKVSKILKNIKNYFLNNPIYSQILELTNKFEENNNENKYENKLNNLDNFYEDFKQILDNKYYNFKQIIDKIHDKIIERNEKEKKLLDNFGKLQINNIKIINENEITYPKLTQNNLYGDLQLFSNIIEIIDLNYLKKITEEIKNFESKK